MNATSLTTPRLLVIIIAGIGDLILASMGLRAIRNGHPSARIHLLTSTEAAPIARKFPFVDRVWSFPMRQFRDNKKALAGVIKCLAQLRSYRFEKIVNLYQVASLKGAIKMGLLFASLKSPCKVGHGRFGFGLFLKQKVPEGFFQNRHMADSILSMAQFAGGIPDRKGIEIPRSEKLRPELKQRLQLARHDRHLKLIAVHPGADDERKRLDPEVFSSAVNQIAAFKSMKTIVLGGAGEKTAADRITRGIQGPVINIAGKTSLEELIFIVDHMDLLIANDSGPMHIAAALQKPVVALFSATNPEIFCPYGDPDNFRIVQCTSFTMKGGKQALDLLSSKIASDALALLST